MLFYLQKSANLSENLSHDELVEVTVSSLCTIIKTDSLLKDLPTDITLDEITSKITVEHGKSITIKLIRDNQTPLDVIIPQDSTISDLKRAIKKHFTMYQSRSKQIKDVKISWKYIWRTHDLSFMGTSLVNNNETIANYGIINKSTIKFIKKHRNNTQ